MDQVKVAVAWLKKYYFWVLCVVVSLMGMVAWNLATASISTQFEQYSSDVNRRVSEQQQIVQSNPDHPNDEVNEGFAQLNDQLRQSVFVVWRQLYEGQRNAVLKWPKEMRGDFLEYIQTKKFGDLIDIEYRERYQNYIAERFRELSRIVEARKVELSAGEGEEGRPYRPPVSQPTGETTTPAEEEHYLVEWATENQEALQKKLVWSDPPTSIKMWITQEDLWVYETLLNIIARTNDGATGAHNAKVTVINALEVGQDAAPGSVTRGRIVMLAKPEGEGVEETGGRPPDAAYGAPGMEEGGRPTEIVDPEARDRYLLAGRYIDAVGMPLPLPEEGTVVAANDEFKRVPVRLTLQMDPRELPRLLVECANAALPVEVQHVRMNVDGAASNTSGEYGGGRSSRTPSSGESPTGAELRQVAQVKVIIQGVIYIFNPPNLEKLGIDPASLAPPAEAAPAPAPTENTAAPAPEAAAPAAESAPAAAPADAGTEAATEAAPAGPAP